MDLGIYLSMTSSLCIEIFMDGENSFNFFKKTATMEHCMSLFYLVYKYWSHKYCWLKLGNENIKTGKHVNLENLSKQQQQQQKNNFGDKEDERKKSMWINVLLMVSVPYLQ